MNSRHVELVQQSFTQLAPVAPAAAELFYNRLFHIAPDTRLLFKGDLRAQGTQLMNMIGMAVRQLAQPAALLPMLRLLGARHHGYGVTTRHYDQVGAALLWTLQMGLGERFTPELREAWTETYGLIAGAMQEGAAQAANAPTLTIPNAAA
jgi:hemoglobin-like flavoprotein